MFNARIRSLDIQSGKNSILKLSRGINKEVSQTESRFLNQFRIFYDVRFSNILAKRNLDNIVPDLSGNIPGSINIPLEVVRGLSFGDCAEVTYALAELTSLDYHRVRKFCTIDV